LSALCYWLCLHDALPICLVVASMLVGAIFGSGASGPMSDRLGRRRVVFIIAIIYIVGALILALAPSMPVLVIGRLVIGLLKLALDRKSTRLNSSHVSITY